MTLRQFFASALVAGLFAATGCTSRLVNLTPRNAVGTASGVHHFEVEWDSSLRGANNPDVQAYVMIGEELLPLQRIPNTADRWEGDVPIPTDKPVISYRYKFDYTRPGFGARVVESELSPPYFLDLRTAPPVQLRNSQ
ncbi:MAG: hypothetical protein J0L84_07015 [Verrucomicrobia bacterium]|nr:hypothetical protein [Verrucomicrobiota bacterium]